MRREMRGRKEMRGHKTSEEGESLSSSQVLSLCSCCWTSLSVPYFCLDMRPEGKKQALGSFPFFEKERRAEEFGARN